MLLRLLRQAAAEAPEQPVVVSARGAVTYRDAVANSEAILRGLARRSVERFACIVDNVADLLALLCASSEVGSEACVYPDTLDADGVRRNAALLGHELLVTDRSGWLPPPTVIRLDDLKLADASTPEPSQRSPALILTTGTTGNPRGARHEWSRLVESTHQPEPDPQARWLLAYNLNQFAGIQIMLHVLLSRATLVVGRSRHPRDGLAAMRELDVTHVSATPTFWRYVAGSIDDESARSLSLRQVTLGGEAVPARLLERLRRLFPHARISQIYGATEFGLGLSVRDERAGLPLSLLERGDDADVRFRIVDGELQVRSRIGMLGYYGEDDAGDGWRPTGDLVEVRDNRIHFVGRATETINVGGVKVHPLPVEELTSAVAGVELARAYAHPNPVTGQIVALDVVASTGADTQQVEREIRTACTGLPPANRPRRIRFVDELEIKGHKIARGSRAPG